MIQNSKQENLASGVRVPQKSLASSVQDLSSYFRQVNIYLLSKQREAQLQNAHTNNKRLLEVIRECTANLF